MKLAIKRLGSKEGLKSSSETIPLNTSSHSYPSYVSENKSVGLYHDSDINVELSEARKILYVSHLVAKFAEQGWQFCVVLFLAALTNYDSIIFVSTYGLFCGLMTCLFGSACGTFIDSKIDRLLIVQFFICCENLSIAIASICCFFLLREINGEIEPSGENVDGEAETHLSQLFQEVAAPLNAKTWTLIAAIHIFGGIAKLVDDGFTVCMEKDWIVVMSKFHSSIFEEELSVESAPSCESAGLETHILKDLNEKAWLSQTNTSMRQIDLACKILAPYVAGTFINYFDSSTISNLREGSNLANAALLLGILNVISLYIEYWCSKSIYNMIPSLAVRLADDDHVTEVIPQISEHESGETAGEGVHLPLKEIIEIPQISENHDGETGGEGMHPSLQEVIREWDLFGWSKSIPIYFDQSISLAGLALALLYLNVLTFGAIMTAYLVSRGMSFQSVGYWRGISSIIGLSGTLAFHFSQSCNGLLPTALWSIIMQCACLIICSLSILITNVQLSLFLLISGVCMSRIGLVCFDLAVTQMMQQLIPEDIRGTIGGVQKSMESFFELATFALGFMFPNVKDFYILVVTGTIAVFTSMCCYGFGVYLQQENFIEL